MHGASVRRRQGLVKSLSTGRTVIHRHGFASAPSRGLCLASRLMRSVRMPAWARARLLRRARLVLAVVLLVLGGLAAMSPPSGAGEPRSVDVLVAARDLAGGV